MDELGRQVKDEIRLRPSVERDTSEKVLKITDVHVFVSTKVLDAL